MTIPELLEQARLAHQQYRDAVPHRVPNGSTTMVVDGDPVAARAALTKAQDYLQQAISAGLVPTADQRALLAFYSEQLSR